MVIVFTLGLAKKVPIVDDWTSFNREVDVYVPVLDCPFTSTVGDAVNAYKDVNP